MYGVGNTIGTEHSAKTGRQSPTTSVSKHNGSNDLDANGDDGNSTVIATARSVR